MDYNWKDEFAPHILTRGKQYFEEGRVTNIVQYGNRITAHVEGTENYYVEIDLPGGVPDSWLCTCPYAVKGNCKHKAAVLFAIEAGEYVFSDEEDFFEETVELLWETAIKNLPEEILRQELLMDYKNSRLQERLAIHYLKEMPQGGLLSWKHRLQNYSKYAMLGKQEITQRDVKVFLSSLGDVIQDRVYLLMEVGAVLDAFYLLGAIYEAAIMGVVEDPDDDLKPFVSWCDNLWTILIDDATDAQQEQMIRWFWNKRGLFFKNAASTGDLNFLYYEWSIGTKRLFLNLVEDTIPCYSECKELELVIDCHIEMMEMLECSENEIYGFMMRHLKYNCVRHWLLTVLDARSKDEEIIQLLNRLSEIDANDLPRLIQDYVWLLKIYDRMGEHTKRSVIVSSLLNECKEKMKVEMPNVVNASTAKRFVACLDALRELEDQEVQPMIEFMVNSICSNPAVARKGVVEIFNAAGYEWPKAYRFPT